MSEPDFIASMIQFVDQTLQTCRVKKDQQVEHGGMSLTDQALKPIMPDLKFQD